MDVYESISGTNSYWVREQAASWWDKKHRGCKHSGIRLTGNQQSKLDRRPVVCRAAVSVSISLTQSVCLVWGCKDAACADISLSWIFGQVWGSWICWIYFICYVIIVSLLSFPIELPDGCAQDPSVHQAAQRPAGLLNRRNKSWFQLKCLWLSSNKETPSKWLLSK